MQPIGKYLVVLGLILTALGGILWLAGNRFNWFGHLPGDIRVERPNFKIYAPLMSMFLLSIFFSIVIWLIRRFF